MKTGYTIYSSNGFIGFCFIFNNGNFIQSGLSLFETISLNGNTMMFQQNGNWGIYQNNTADINVIGDLMQKAIPSLRTNGLTYYATDANGTKQQI